MLLFPSNKFKRRCTWAVVLVCALLISSIRWRQDYFYCNKCLLERHITAWGLSFTYLKHMLVIIHSRPYFLPSPMADAITNGHKCIHYWIYYGSTDNGYVSSVGAPAHPFLDLLSISYAPSFDSWVRSEPIAIKVLRNNWLQGRGVDRVTADVTLKAFDVLKSP